MGGWSVVLVACTLLLPAALAAPGVVRDVAEGAQVAPLPATEAHPAIGMSARDGAVPGPWALLEAIEADPAVRHALASSPGYQGVRALYAANQTASGPSPAAKLGDALAVGWAAAFYGTPLVLAEVDLDGDEDADVVAGTETGVVAVDGRTWSVRWFRPTGVTVTALVVSDVDGKPGKEIVFGTSSGARDGFAAMLRARDGGLVWEVATESSVLHVALTSAEGPDVLVADTSGRHLRLAGATGAIVWDEQHELLPSASALVAGHLHLGHYLARSGDITGDGVPDLVSAALSFAYASLVGYDLYTVVHATDGATGDLLWSHVVGGDPAYLAMHILTDMHLLDTRGDGTLDVALAGLSVRYYYVPFALSEIVYNPFLRAVDGSATVVALATATRESATPLLPLELYLDLDHTDIEADGIEDIVVLRSDLIRQVLNSVAVSLERYTFATGPDALGPRALVSDLALPLGSGARLAPSPRTAGARDTLVVEWAFDGKATRVDPAGRVVGAASFAAHGARSALLLGDRVLVGTDAGLEVRPQGLAGSGPRVPFFGVPRDMAPALSGSTPVFLVRSSDDAVHVLDRLRGERLARHEVPGLRQIHVDRGDPSIVLLEADIKDKPERLVAQHRLPGMVAGWSEKTRVQGSLVWFDGDGDRRDDVLIQAGYVDGDYRAKALRGRDGGTLFDAELPTGTFSLAVLPVRLFGDRDDLVLRSYSDVWALSGRDGKELWTLELDATPRCWTAADLDGNGRETILAWTSWDGDTKRLEIGADGKAKEATLAADTSLYSCTFLATTDRKDVAVFLHWSRGDSERGLARVTSAGLGWSHFVEATAANPFPEAPAPLAIDAAAADGGVVYAAWGPTFRTYRWSDGGVRGDVALAVPAAQAVLADVDGHGDLDVVVRASDGLVRALGRDLRIPAAAAVSGTTPGEALPPGVLPGTAPPEGTHEGGGEGVRPGLDSQVSPDLPGIAGGAVVLLAALRHSRRRII